MLSWWSIQNNFSNSLNHSAGLLIYISNKSCFPLPEKQEVKIDFRFNLFKFQLLGKKQPVLTAIVLRRLCNTYLSTLMVFAEQTWTQNPERSCWRGLVWEPMGGWKNKTPPLSVRIIWRKNSHSNSSIGGKDICNYLFFFSDLRYDRHLIKQLDRARLSSVFLRQP